MQCPPDPSKTALLDFVVCVIGPIEQGIPPAFLSFEATELKDQTVQGCPVLYLQYLRRSTGIYVAASPPSPLLDYSLRALPVRRFALPESLHHLRNIPSGNNERRVSQCVPAVFSEPGEILSLRKDNLSRTTGIDGDTRGGSAEHCNHTATSSVASA